jgi:hypothetical protein
MGRARLLELLAARTEAVVRGASGCRKGLGLGRLEEAVILQYVGAYGPNAAALPRVLADPEVGRLGPEEENSMREELGRDRLPVPDRPYAGPVFEDAKDPEASFPPIEPLRPPAGAPNVLVVLLDDVGFGASSAFGGPCATPTAERLAEGGLKLNRFHTTALCSPTRQGHLVLYRAPRDILERSS